MKVGRILDSLNFGSADGPRVRGERSAVHEICHQRLCRKMFQSQKYTADGLPRDSGRSVDHRCNRLASDTPVVCPLSKAWTVRQGSVDSPPVLRKIYQRQFQSGVFVKIFKADGPPGGRGRSAPAQKGGVGQI